MRIALWHNLPTGGGLRAFDDQVRGLAGRGHELHVWMPPTAVRSSALDLAASVHEVPLDRPVAAKTIREGVTAAWRGRREDLDAFVEHSARCAAEIDDLGPDVVLAHPCQFFRVPAVAVRLRAPAALYLPEPNRQLYEATFPGFPWAATPKRRRLRPSTVRRFVKDLARIEASRIQVGAERSWIDAFDEVLVNSAYSRESVLRAYARLSRVCLLGIDTDWFRPLDRPDHGRGTVLSVGAVVVEKNLPFLIRAVAAAGPVVQRFVWVANYVDARQRAIAEGVAAEVSVPFELRSAVSEAELLAAYAEADLFVYAPRLEPFGLAPLEANATGLPVVAVAEGGVRESVVDGRNGVVVEHDEERFGAAVAELLGDIECTRALGRAAREHVVEHWAMGPAIDRLEARLGAVASGAAATR